MKKFIMYGAGNIGRGFIGQIFSDANYKVGFVDINMEVISKLNTDKRYPINIVTSEDNVEKYVENVFGIDGRDIELVSNEIATCDAMATAIGVNVLKFIAKPLALGIKKRFELNKKPLNIIICENLIGADEYLKSLVKNEIPELSDYIEESVGFVEASVGRMVPVITEERRKDNFLRVYVEPYNILPVDKDAFRSEIPDCKNLFPFSPFGLFIQRKLFMHNMSHALCAYLGNLRGHEYIYQAVEDFDIRYVAFKALTEMAVSISLEHNTEITPLIKHADNLLYRFKNRALGDTVARVGKDTKRKLSANDRLIGALNLSIKNNIPCYYLCIAVAAALLFNKEDDQSSLELFNYAKEFGVRSALEKYSQFSSPQVELIEKFYVMLSEGKSLRDLINYCDNEISSAIIV